MRRFLFENDPTARAETPLEKKRPLRMILAWFCVAFWGGIIWILGGDSFSFSDTNDEIMPWLDWLTGDLDWRTRSAARHTRLATAGWVALFIVTALATADEARQSFSAVRTGSPYDILIDVAGGLLAVLGLIVISRRMRLPRREESSA